MPSGFNVPDRGIAASGGTLYVADTAGPGDSVWTCTLSLVQCSEANLPSGWTVIAQGITASGGMLYVADADAPDSVWTCTLALVCSEAGSLPSGVGSATGIAASGGTLYVVDNAIPQVDMDMHVCLWRALRPPCLEDFGDAQGITASGDAPCEVAHRSRVYRGGVHRLGRRCAGYAPGRPDRHRPPRARDLHLQRADEHLHA